MQASPIPDWSRLSSVQILRQSRVFRLCMTDGRDYVLKRTRGRADWEVWAAAIGMIERLGVRTVPAATVHFDDDLLLAWNGVAGQCTDCLRSGEVLLLMPYIEAVTLRTSGNYYRDATARQKVDLYEAIGRLWVFDILIDNSDRLIKGVNAENLLVSNDLRLYAIDQELGRDLTADHDHTAGRFRRRLEELRTPALRGALCADLFDEINRGLADYRLQDRDAFCHAAGAGLVSGVRNVALVTASEIGASIGSRATTIPGLGGALEEFRVQAAVMC